MPVGEMMWQEVVGFFQIWDLLVLIQAGWSTAEPFAITKAVLGPLLPVLVLVELALALTVARNGRQMVVYKVNFLIYVANRVLGRVFGLALIEWIASLLSGHALIDLPLSWLGFVYGYLVWELAHYLYHFLCHKVRIFWCLHATHHAPEAMNLSVAYAHFYLEIPFAQVVRTVPCVLLGIPLEMLIVIMLFDGIYGGLIHVGEGLLPDGRFGALGKFILTPAHHRVHHARNPLYIDTNYCNLLNVWDRLFGTYQEQLLTVPPEYGISRVINSSSFVDVYLGEILALLADCKKAKSWKNRVLYIVMPPGWMPGDVSKTASVVRSTYLQVQAAADG